MAVAVIIIVTGGGSGDGYNGGYGGGGGNGPRERLRKKPQKILPTEKKGIPFGASNVKGNTSGGNRRTPRYLAHRKRTTRCKTRGGLPTARK